jgi:integrase/recombinase XerD
MNNLRAAVSDYLELRRSLGFRLKTDERYLRKFADFMERRHATHITAKLAVKWAQQPAPGRANYLAGRLRAVRSGTCQRF